MAFETRVVAWNTLAEKANWLDAAASMDTALKYVRQFASRFAKVPTLEAKAHEIHRWVRDNIRYVRDWRETTNSPGERFADSESILKQGYEDCDGKARLFVALCRTCGVDARIRPVFKKHPELAFTHVQAEVRWPGSERLSYAMPGGWVLAELILKGCEIGMNPDDMPRDKKGNRILA